VSNAISGLLPATVYHARVVALNNSGSATGADPTVGLVFYDLKTLLRQIAEGDGKAADEEQERTDGPA